jgi:serine/threonine-protein kinase
MKIFISYRRAEDNKSYIVGTIHERLAKVFGEKDIFRDTYDISGGADWRDILGREINSCKVMLVIIGPNWANLANLNGKKRLFDRNDVTRWEVETGLRRSQAENVTVVPVLVLGAKIPAAAELPKSLHPLLDKNVINIRNFPDFDSDMGKLIRDIRQSLGYAEEDISTQYFEPKTIYIAEGVFWMGSPAMEGIPTYETPQHEVILPAFRIGKYPVTNKQYEHFIRQNPEIEVPRQMGWDGQTVPKGLENYPVTGVTWDEARAYCEWLSSATDGEYSLPNEAQWEKACRGGNKYFYPWGDEFDPTRCNYGQDGLSPVDKYPAQNEYECFDFVGNVLQWTCTLWEQEASLQETPYPWREDGRNDLNANSETPRVLRGSTMKDHILDHRCSARRGDLPGLRGYVGARCGFRVIRNV